MTLVNLSKTVAADVHAKGFTIARVRVVDGKIEVRPTARTKGKLPAGEALLPINFRLADDGSVMSATISAKDLDGKAAGLVPSKHGWLRAPVEATADVSGDPAAPAAAVDAEPVTEAVAAE